MEEGKLCKFVGCVYNYSYLRVYISQTFNIREHISETAISELATKLERMRIYLMNYESNFTEIH